MLLTFPVEALILFGNGLPALLMPLANSMKLALRVSSPILGLPDAFILYLDLECLSYLCVHRISVAALFILTDHLARARPSFRHRRHLRNHYCQGLLLQGIRTRHSEMLFFI